MICAGCAALPQVVKRELPPASSVVLDEVPLPAVAKGQDARIALAKARAVANEANARLKRSRAIYDGIRQKYGAGT